MGGGSRGNAAQFEPPSATSVQHQPPRRRLRRHPKTYPPRLLLPCSAGTTPTSLPLCFLMQSTWDRRGRRRGSHAGAATP